MWPCRLACVPFGLEVVGWLPSEEDRSGSEVVAVIQKALRTCLVLFEDETANLVCSITVVTIFFLLVSYM